MKLRKFGAPRVITYWIVCKPHSKGSATSFSVSVLRSQISIHSHTTLKPSIHAMGWILKMAEKENSRASSKMTNSQIEV